MAQLEHEVEEKPRKKSFFNLDRIFLKMSEISEKPVNQPSLNENKDIQAQQALEKAQNEQSEQANKFLNAELFEYYFAMIKNGYLPNEKQENRMVQKFNQLLAHNSPEHYISTFNDYIKSGFQFNDSLVWNLITNTNFAEKIFSYELFNQHVPFSVSTIRLTTKNTENNNSHNTKEEFDLWQKQKRLNANSKKFSPQIQTQTVAVYQEIIKNQIPDSRIVSTNHSQIEDDLLEKSATEEKKLLQDPENVEFYNELRKILFSDSFAKFSANKMKTFIKDYIEESSKTNSINATNFKIAKTLNPLLNFMPHIVLKEMPINDFLSFITEHNQLLDGEHFQSEALVKNNQRQFKEILDKQYAPAITQLLNKTKEVYTNSYFQQKAIQNAYSLAQEYSVYNLPQNTQFLIADIQKNYGVLQKHVSSLTEEQLFDIDNLFDKRVPEVLQKYFSIDQEYRNSLTNSEGKNASQLMDESLVNFNNKFKEIIEDLNENKLSDLSATKRYSKSI